MAILLIGGFAGACATATTEPESTTRIESDPSGAVCTLANQKGFSKQITTPVSITLHRDLAPLTIACTAPGHASIREELKMDGNAMVLGNILLGGLVGVAIDAASGASQRFPDKMTVLLDPSEFDSIAARDAWYEKKKQRIEKEAFEREIELDNTHRPCQYNSRNCMDLKDKLGEQKRAELAKLEAVRNTAKVRNVAAVPLGKSGSCLVEVGVNRWEPQECPTVEPAKADDGLRKVMIDGKETCLSQTGQGTWQSVACPPPPKRTEVMIDGRKKCLVETTAGSWKETPCVN